MIKKKIILDCDPGHDDAVAIMLAAASKEIELLGITCVGGNVELDYIYIMLERMVLTLQEQMEQVTALFLC